MSPQRGYILLIVTAIAILLAGCADETAELKQKIADLEKKVQQQEKDLREFAGKFALPKDFDADIQRIEDQQEQSFQVLKTKVDPVDTKTRGKVPRLGSGSAKRIGTLWVRSLKPWSNPARKSKKESKRKAGKLLA